jgi:hypothetical protein
MNNPLKVLINIIKDKFENCYLKISHEIEKPLNIYDSYISK